MKPLSASSVFVRLIHLGVFVAAAVALLIPGFRAIRQEHQVKTLLLEIQRSLQDWHVAEEVYPRKTPMSGAELIGLLVESGEMESPPHNPWTGRPYQPGQETEATDRIRYSTDQLAETFALKALNRDDDQVFLQIDSTEHQSLE